MNRKEFLTNAGVYCVCGCVAAMTGILSTVSAQDSAKSTEKPPEPPPEKSRSQTRIEFAEKWAVRFFDVFDAHLDEATRKKIMMANGKSCYVTWITETGQQIRQVTLEQIKAWIDAHPEDKTYSYDGDVLYFQYTSAAETGLASRDNQCLCPFLETNPTGLSATYCYCSVGYVKEQHDRFFGKPVEVELLSSVLRGDPRCRFKISVC